MAHVVRRLEIDRRSCRRRAYRNPIDVIRRAVGEEYRTGLRAHRDHVARAVVFLVAPRALVLLDDVAIVFVDREARRQAQLRVVSHAQAIEVDARLVVDEERGLAQRGEVVGGALVHGVRVRIGAGRQFDFRARHAQETERVALRQLPRFLCADDVVGNGSDSVGVG
jgi:hypothetical protein